MFEDLYQDRQMVLETSKYCDADIPENGYTEGIINSSIRSSTMGISITV